MDLQVLRICRSQRLDMGLKRVSLVRRYQGQCRALRPLGHQRYRLRSYKKDPPLCSGYRWKAPPGERPSATPTASNAGPQGCTLWGQCWVPTPAPTATGTHGSRNPSCPPQRTGGRGREESVIAISTLCVCCASPAACCWSRVSCCLFLMRKMVYLLKYNQSRISQAGDKQVEEIQDQSMKGCSVNSERCKNIHRNCNSRQIVSDIHKDS